MLKERGIAGRAALDTHHERDLQGLKKKALLDQIERQADVPRVVDLYLGLDTQFDHARRQLLHLLRRIAELGAAERHGGRVQSGHGRP